MLVNIKVYNKKNKRGSSSCCRLLQGLMWFSPKSCLTLCDPVACSRPGFPVLRYFPEFAQTHVH